MASDEVRLRLRAVGPASVPRIDTGLANVARAWNYMVGGKDNFEGNTHEVAQSVAPECRVVYVDNDPVVLSHARALLTSDPAGVTSYIDADARDPGAILAEAGTVLDFGAPAAVIMVDLLNFIERDEAARAATSTLMAAVAPGSYLAIMHPASDLDPALPEAVRPGGRGRPGQGAVARPVRSRGSTGRPPAGRPGR